MKTALNYSIKKKIILLFFTPTLFISCDFLEDLFGNGCDLLELADLIIPKVVQHYNNQGSPIFESSNELYFNERTGEYFNEDSPPSFGLQVGDYIQIATRIFNTVTQGDCMAGATAPVSTTAPELTISSPSFNGVFQTPSMFTPSIPVNNNTLTATRFQLITPGNYKINFNANAPRNFEEHSYNNNYYYGENGNYSKTNTFSFNVLEGKTKININVNQLEMKQAVDAPKNIEEMQNLQIFKFIESTDYKIWVEKSILK